MLLVALRACREDDNCALRCSPSPLKPSCQGIFVRALRLFCVIGSGNSSDVVVGVSVVAVAVLVVVVVMVMVVVVVVVQFRC